MKTLTDIKNCRGLSLIELMIAMTIGLLLLGATVSMFISNKRIYKEQEEMGLLRENASFALQLLIEDIRMAGYAGCSDDMENVKNHLNDGGDEAEIFSFRQAIEGLDNLSPGDGSALYNNLYNNLVMGTDALAVRYLQPRGIRLSEAMPNESARFTVTTASDLLVGDIIALSDCDSADIMQVTGEQTNNGAVYLEHDTSSSDPGNATDALQKKYNQGAEILRLVARRYYIGTNANGNPSLYRFHRARREQGTGGVVAPVVTMAEYSQELIEGIENMQILYGIDNDDDTIADEYLDAAGVSNWQNVVSVRLALLLSTIEEGAGNDIDYKTYDLLGEVLPAAQDKKRRRMVSTTVQIRNRS